MNTHNSPSLTITPKNYRLKYSTVERLNSLKDESQSWDDLFNELIDTTVNCLKNHPEVTNG